MSDWESDEDVKPAAPIQPQQRYNQHRESGNDRRGYGNDQRNGYNQQNNQRRDNRQSFGSNGRDNRQSQNFGGNGRGNQQNFGYGRQDDNYRNDGNRDRGGGGYNRYGGNDFQMEVNSSKVGMIIGKGGSKIREIQEKHNVNVKIGELT